MATTTIKIGPVRGSYLNIFKPRRNNLNDNVEYSAVWLFPKKKCEFNDDPNGTVKRFKESVDEVVAEHFGKQTHGLRNPLRDGDTELNSNGEPRAPGYWFINSTAKEDFPPKVVDGDKVDADPKAWKSGDWAIVVLALYPYDKKGNKGVSCGLRAVQFLYSDEALGSGADPLAGLDVVPGAHKPQPVATVAAHDDEGAFDPFADE